MFKRLLTLLTLSLFVLPSSAFAVDKVYTGYFSDNAVSGYDTVAYFTQGKPVKGNKKFHHDWKGAKWLFASQENLDLFKADPNKYAPQYGGYCAYAVAKGETASTDPKNWKIVDGKLYLNYSASVQKEWDSKHADYIVTANGNWPKICKDC